MRIQRYIETRDGCERDDEGDYVRFADHEKTVNELESRIMQLIADGTNLAQTVIDANGIFINEMSKEASKIVKSAPIP